MLQMMETMMRPVVVEMVLVMMLAMMRVLLLEAQDRALQAAWQDRDAASLLSEV